MVGRVRVVSILGGVDGGNMCCGTHVSNTAQLQCVKLLRVEQGRHAAGGGGGGGGGGEKTCLVVFVAGVRVVR